ncbi:hypothetical protein FRB95_003531 [Tulasnella sp. JGI-2019a]|nr:hypothetical protein FRB95_003531 [Tulasnella sp. JGI-2019a]
MQTSDADNLFRTESAIRDEEARRLKADRTKNIAEPITISSKVIKAVVRGDEVWTAESAHIARRVDLQTGKTLQIYKGHTGPVTCLALYDLVSSDGTSELLLITGSWDKSIKIWNTSSKQVICDTPAHGDFVKSLFIMQSSHILVSGSSDKSAKLWDLSNLASSLKIQRPLHQLASLSGHTRPVEALAYSDDVPNTLLTADSMGVIKVWSLEDRWQLSPESLPTVKARLHEHATAHSTGINDLVMDSGYLWTASTDQTVTLRQYHSKTPLITSPASQHTLERREPARCVLVVAHKLPRMPYVLIASGDMICLYDVEELLSSADEEDDKEDPATKLRRGRARLLCEVDVHSQPVTSLGIWRKETPEGAAPWIVSGSLDGTLRRWDLAELVAGKIPKAVAPDLSKIAAEGNTGGKLSALTEEEERELAEMMAED